MKKYQVTYCRVETITYMVTVEAENEDNISEIAREALEENNWTCERKGEGGNCIDAEESVLCIMEIGEVNAA